MKTVLVVDDDPDLAAAVGDALALRGYAVSFAEALRRRFDEAAPIVAEG